MRKVHRRAWWWAVVGGLVLLAVHAVAPLTIAGWAAGATSLAASSALLSLGLRRRLAARLGAANAVTATRSMLVGVVTAMVATSFSVPTSVPLLVAIAACALALDAVDGFVARHTGTASELGARFDMEVDAFLILVLCAYDARIVGWWVLSLGLLRYAFVAAAWLLPWMAVPLPPRYWRKVVAAATGIVLTAIAAELLPVIVAVVLAAAALALLLESFGRDVVWLARMNRTTSDLVSSSRAVRRSGPEESRPT